MTPFKRVTGVVAMVALVALTFTSCAMAAETSAPALWRPTPGTSWQWQLDSPVDTTVDAQVYDVDLFTTDAATVERLHAAGRKVICYVNVGAWEDWRPDRDRFPAALIGKEYVGWPGERWLDIRAIDRLGPLLEARLDECRNKGFDAVEPDNIDAVGAETGFPLTNEDQLRFNRWIAAAAHARGLSIALKNDPEQVPDLVNDFDFAISEDCFHLKECEAYLPFIAANKAVFAAEYKLPTTAFCPQAVRMNVDAIRKHRDLDAARTSCR